MLQNLSGAYLDRVFFSLVAILVTYICSMLLKRGIDVVFKGVHTTISEESTLARTRTIRSLLKNIIDVAIFVIGILVILSQWSINIVPLLTGAGLVGLAISFGAQTLVKDVISGFFIILENQFSVGDRIKVADHEGTVQQVTLRLTVLKDKAGNLIYIPNSQITTVVRKK